MHKKIIFKSILFFTLLFAFSIIIFPQKSYAVPAYPGLFELKQPSGYAFEARKRGDEWYNWVETKDGYGIYKNTVTDYWEYYTPDIITEKDTKRRTEQMQDGKKRAIVGEADPSSLGISKGLRPPRKEDSRPWKPTKPKTSPQISPHPSPLPHGERGSLLPQEKRERRLGEADRLGQMKISIFIWGGTNPEVVNLLIA